MHRIIKNIAHCVVVGFLLIAISGVSISIHHEHAIGQLSAEHEHGQHEGLGVSAASSTYHEIHVLTLLSNDSFNGSSKAEFKTPFAKLLDVPLDLLEVSPIHHSTSLAYLDIKETGPPSVDKCVLFCSFLI